MRKGQAEIALIVGIVIVALGVALYSFSSLQAPPTGPGGLTSEQKSVESYVLDALEKSAMQSLTLVYKQGGYINPEDEEGTAFVEYAGSMVPYWQICQNTYTLTDAQIVDNIETGTREILKNTLPDRTDLAGKVVEFDRDSVEVEASIHTDKVSFTATVPTVVNGQPSNQPYKMEIKSRLGRISDFATDFSSFQKKNRALEENLMKLIRRSNPYEECWLPTLGLHIDGGMYMLSWNNAMKCMETHIKYSLAHTQEWDWPPLDDGHPTEFGFKYNYIPQIENAAGEWVRYDDLDVLLAYGGGNTPLTRTDNEYFFGTDPDPIKIKPTQIGPFKIPDGYNIKYDVSFPVAVLVMDDYMGIPFRFMTFANVRDNVRADCTKEDFETEVESDYVQKCETGLIQDVDITVKRKGTEQGLSGVYVFFDEMCNPWMTDGQGKVSGAKAPQMTNPKIDFYDFASSSSYSVCPASSSSLNGMDVYMPIREDFKMKLYRVEIEKSGGTYTITDIDPVSGSASMEEKVDVEMIRNPGTCPPEEDDIPYAFKNYYYSQVDDDNLMLVVNEDGVIDKAVYEEATAGMEGNNVRFEVQETYDLKVTMDEYGSVTDNDVTLPYGVYDQSGGKNIIYVFAPKIISGGYTEADDAKLAGLYEKCKLPLLSKDSKTLYEQAYQPGNPASHGVLGCWYQ